MDAYAIDNGASMPKRRKKAPLVPDNVRKELARYKLLYKACFKREPVIEYTKPFIRIDGQPGVTVKRLTELTRMLRERVKDL